MILGQTSQKYAKDKIDGALNTFVQIRQKMKLRKRLLTSCQNEEIQFVTHYM